MTTQAARVGAIAAFALGSLFAPRAAEACGSSGPDGISACSLADYEEAQRPRWRVGASGVYTSTVLSFGSGLQAGETRQAALVEVSYAPSARVSASLGLGVGFGGRLLTPDGAYSFNPGTVLSVGVSHRFAEAGPPKARTFLVWSWRVSYTGASTEAGNGGPSTAYDALNLRIGLAAGCTWFHRLSAYAVGRAFGGPVFWTYQGASQLGTDTHHYQVGGGLALLLFRRLDLFVEGVPLGEQAASAGLSVAF